MAEYFVDAVGGLDSNPGTEAQPKQTITAGEGLLANGDHLWIKASGDYNETVTIATGGGNYLPKSWEGYTSVKGDGGIATINGQSTRANGVTHGAARNQRVYRNILVKNTTNTGWSLSSSTGNTFVNCHADTTVAPFNISGQCAKFLNCTATSCSGNWTCTGTGSVLLACRLINGSAGGFTVGNGLVMFCVVSGLGSSSSAVSMSTATGTHIICNNIFDGRGQGRGVLFSAAPSTNLCIIANNIFRRLTDGIRGTTTDNVSYTHLERNIFESVTNKYPNVWGGDARTPPADKEVNVTPTFVDAANNNYAPLSDSPQLQKGIDYQTILASAGMDIGPIQAAVGGGGGTVGLVAPIGTTGGTS